MLDIKVSMEK